jgi:hypothetical protein
MMIGQDIVVSAINNNTRAKAILNILSLAGLKKISEKFVKEIVTFPREKGVGTSLNELAGANVDYSRAYLPYSLYNSVLSGEGLTSPG